MRACFDEFVLDLEKRELSRAGTPIHIAPKAFLLLQTLLERAPKAVSKEEIYRDIWAGTFVDEANISNLASEVRSLLGDDKKRPRFITTVHRFGYRFVGDVKWERAHGTSNSRCSIVWATREFVLAEGENIIGREAEAAVPIDSPGVSRRHACVTIVANRATIEDLGSKNGTLVRGERITSPLELRNGETIRLGSASLLFRKSETSDSTLTEAVL